MEPVSHQKIVHGNLQPVGIGQQPQVIQNAGNLKGSVPRFTVGVAIIICGIIEIMLMIELRTSFDSYLGVVGWGIWNGAVITFMVLAIIATLMSIIWWGHQASLVPCGQIDSDRYIMITVTYALQACLCVIGAGFTCTALSADNQPQQVIVSRFLPVTPPAMHSYGAVMFDQPPAYTPNISGNLASSSDYCVVTAQPFYSE
ncbi:uncharacterized protein [Apostichopus japonicus]|uniref:uncharacterized protein isoform X2 n=1 Tax=Stichopus japonicus TaxID=307972 RepID=UPI003AB8031B